MAVFLWPRFVVLGGDLGEHGVMSVLFTMRSVRTTPEGFLWEPVERWVRGRKGEVTVVDSRHPVLVWEPDWPVPLRWHSRRRHPSAGVVWSYSEPLPAVAAIKGRLAFYNEAVDIAVDGERMERPVTPFTATLSPRASS
jgi:hypothetical protein